MIAKCMYCTTEIVSQHNSYRRVIGWTRPRRGGGANQITGAEMLDQWACVPCVNKLRRGVNPHQESLQL